jgi:hypothetical protein
MLNSDYKDILCGLSEEKAKFILVGAYALAAHGYPRSTGDIDLWVKPERDNAEAIMRALLRFGAPGDTISPVDFQTGNMVLQIGVAPRRIDIITSIDGLTFDEAFAHSELTDIDDIPIHVLSIPDLIHNKRATGRTKDLADAEMLEKENGDTTG